MPKLLVGTGPTREYTDSSQPTPRAAGYGLMAARVRDCRAVLCRDGEAIELSSDHVLSRGEDSPGACERARVLSEGGSI